MAEAERSRVFVSGTCRRAKTALQPQREGRCPLLWQRLGIKRNSGANAQAFSERTSDGEKHTRARADTHGDDDGASDACRGRGPRALQQPCNRSPLANNGGQTFRSLHGSPLLRVNVLVLVCFGCDHDDCCKLAACWARPAGRFESAVCPSPFLFCEDIDHRTATQDF